MTLLLFFDTSRRLTSNFYRTAKPIFFRVWLFPCCLLFSQFSGREDTYLCRALRWDQLIFSLYYADSLEPTVFSKLLPNVHYMARPRKKGPLGEGKPIPEDPFSAVSTPGFPSQYLFWSSFRDLQDWHVFAPFQIQINSGKVWQRFVNFSAKRLTRFAKTWVCTVSLDAVQKCASRSYLDTCCKMSWI